MPPWLMPLLTLDTLVAAGTLLEKRSVPASSAEHTKEDRRNHRENAPDNCDSEGVSLVDSVIIFFAIVEARTCSGRGHRYAQAG